MADFRIEGGMKVKTLKEEFKNAFGATLRVYTTENCKAFANDEATLSSLLNGKTGGAFIISGKTKVKNFEEKFTQLYGIGVQVANASDSKLVDNEDTLAEAGNK